MLEFSLAGQEVSRRGSVGSVGSDVYYSWMNRILLWFGSCLLMMSLFFSLQQVGGGLVTLAPRPSPPPHECP
jgi:hypothetical protein